MNTEDSEFARIEREQAMRGVPDAIHHTDTSEPLMYIQGWNDCRQAMLEQHPSTVENNGGKTGWPPGLLQDDCKGLSKWLSKQPDARRRVREALAEQPAQTLEELYALSREVSAEQPAPAAQEPVGCEWTPCMKLPVVVHVRKQRLGEAHVSTREGITPVHPDDLIMRGVSGEEYPIGIAIFEQTYTLDTGPQAQPAPKENT